MVVKYSGEDKIVMNYNDYLTKNPKAEDTPDGTIVVEIEQPKVIEK